MSVVHPTIFLGNPLDGSFTRTTRWSLDPKFMCNVVIKQPFPTSSDNIKFGMANVDVLLSTVPINDFGVGIQFFEDVYTVFAFLEDDGGYVSRDLCTVQLDTLYEISAEVKWTDRVVLFSCGSPDGQVVQGVIPFSGSVVDMELTPLWVYGSLTGDGVGQAKLEFYLWKSQGKKRSVPS